MFGLTNLGRRGLSNGPAMAKAKSQGHFSLTAMMAWRPTLAKAISIYPQSRLNGRTTERYFLILPDKIENAFCRR